MPTTNTHNTVVTGIPPWITDPYTASLYVADGCPVDMAYALLARKQYLEAMLNAVFDRGGPDPMLDAVFDGESYALLVSGSARHTAQALTESVTAYQEARRRARRYVLGGALVPLAAVPLTWAARATFPDMVTPQDVPGLLALTFGALALIFGLLRGRERRAAQVRARAAADLLGGVTVARVSQPEAYTQKMRERLLADPEVAQRVADWVDTETAHREAERRAAALDQEAADRRIREQAVLTQVRPLVLGDEQ